MKGIKKKNLRIWGKRLLSFVLITALMLGLIPESAYAAGTQNQSADENVYTSGDCDITYKETSSWGTYANVEVTIKNNGESTIDPWKLLFLYEGTISNIWNADIESSKQGECIIVAKSYNAKLEAGQSVSFGFMAYGEDSKPDMPLSISMEGVSEEPTEATTKKSTTEQASTEKGKTEKPSEDKKQTEGSYTIPEKWKGLNYALFTSGDETLSLYTNETNIYGDVHSNKGFYYQGTSISVDGTLEAATTIDIKTASGADCRKIGQEKEKAEALDMPDITKEVYAYCTENGTVYDETTEFNSDNIVIETPIVVEGSANFNATTFLGKGILYARDSVIYNVGSLATPEDSRVFIAAENGNITLNGSDITLNAVLYAPNGCVNINANNVTLNGRIIAKQVNINGTVININAGPFDFDMLDFLFKPEFELSFAGNKKENRKVTIDVEEIINNEYVIKEDTVWSITRDGIEVKDAYAVDEEASNVFHKEMIFREAGIYQVSVIATTGKVDYTVTKELVIEKDLKPVAAFELEDGYYSRDEEGHAKITIKDASSSPDGDTIGQRIWTVYYDIDNNGEFTENEASVYSDGNDTELIIDTDKVGKYKIVLTVVETFADTIPKLITQDAYLRDDTSEYITESCVFEVGNEAPEAHLTVEKAKSADIVFTISDADKDTMNIYNAKAEALKKILKEKGVDARIDAVSASTLTAQDIFAWKEYGHYNCDGYDTHIIYEEDSIKMIGYYRSSKKDFLYIENNNPGQKTFEFDLQRDHTDWHSMEGGGFLFNTTVSDENNTIQGFCILVAQDGLRLVQIDCDNLKNFCDGDYRWVQDVGKSLGTYPIGNLYDTHHFKIVVDAKTISVWDGENLIIDNFVLPDNDYGYGFGPITSHTSHSCSQRSYFTFKNITMETMSGSSLSDIVAGYEWRPGASHYVINLSDALVPELSSEEETADLAAALIRNEAAFVGIGNEDNEGQYQALLNATEYGGMYTEIGNIDTTMDKVIVYLTDSILSKDYSVGKYFTTDDIISYGSYYCDAENDEIYEQQWEYEYDPSVFGEAAGETEHIVRKENEPITVFEDTGAYAIRLKIRDNPAGDNDAMDSYRLWSGTDEYEKLVVVHSRPKASVKAEVAENATDKASCIVNTTYEAYDADHPGDSAKGIREEYYAYKNVNDANWTEGKMPNRIQMGETYLIKYQVRDIEGLWSFPTATVVKTRELLSYEEIEDNTPPEIYIEASKAEAKVGEALRIEGYAMDDHGVDTFTMYINDEKVLDAFGRVFYTPNKAGTITVKAVAVDIGGNRSEKELTIKVVDDRDKTPPVAEITSPSAGSELDFNVQIKGTATDETKFAKYTLSYKEERDKEYTVFKESDSPVTNDILGTLDISGFADGVYEILLTVEDAAGNVSYYGIVLYIKSGNDSSSETPVPGEPVKKNFAVNLSYSAADIGTEVQVQVTLPDNIKEETLQIKQGDKVIAEGSKRTSFTSHKAGTVTITATGVTDEGETLTVEARCVFYNLQDKNPPTAAITSPTIDQVLTEPVDFVGSAYDEEELDFWKLEYRMAGEEEYILLNEGTEPVKDGVLGHFDTTMMLNGQYNVKLTVQDKGGNIRRLENDYVVEGELKVGAMHIGFTDITAQMGGTTVSVNRMYDSRNKSKGDFGIGWTLGMQGMEIYESRTPLSAGYAMEKTGSLFSTGYQMLETANHDVVVTYGDGTSDRFELTFSPERQALVPISETRIGYRCVTDQKVKLEIIGDTSAYVGNTELMFHDESMYDSLNYKLTTAEGNEIYLNEKDGVYKIVDASGNVITVGKDGYHAENGKSIIFTRDEEDRIIKAEDPTGNVTTYAYDEAGDLVSVTDSADRTVTFTYDRKHNLASITDPMGVAVARNEYDDGRLIATIDADGNRVEYDYDVEGRTQTVKDRRGNTTVYTYDDNGNILQTVDAYGNKTTNTYDEYNNLLSTTDAKGNTTGYAYDSSGNVTEVTAADGTKVKSTYTQENYVSSIQMMDKTVMAMDYDSKGRLSSVEDANGNVTKYSYASDGKLTGLTDKIGEYQKVTYDAEGNVATTTNGAGESASYTYDKDGRVTSVTISREENGETLTFTSTYAYNAAGDIIESVDNAGNVTTYEYDDNGNQTAVMDSKGRRTTYNYDDLGNLVKITYPDGTFETFTYDANGNNITATDRSGLTVTMTYDKLDRMTEKKYADGTKESYVYDEVGNVTEQVSTSGAKTTYAYDERNRNTSITDTYGSVTTFNYDEAARLTARIDAAGNTTSYVYDDNGNITKTTYADGNSVTSEYDARNRVTRQKDQYGNETVYTYDGADRLTGVTDAYGNNYAYGYDDNGNLVTVTDAEEHVTRYAYDEMGRVKTVTNALGKTMEYTYDETGNLTSAKDYAGTVTTYAYDDMDRMTRKTVGTDVTEYTYNDIGLLLTVTDKSGTIRYAYDRYDRLSKQTDAKGVSLTYTYDEAGRLHTFDDSFGKTTYEYDLLDRVTRVIDRNGKATVYEYDELGNRSTVHYPNGNVMTYTYDACQRLKEEWITNANGITLAKYTYGLGKAGERTSVTEINSSGIETETTYKYDKLNRLVKETIERDKNKLTNEYTYDKVSNRISKETTVKGELSAFVDTDLEETKVTEGKTTYTYNALNQLVTETSLDGAIVYTYDDNGNLIKQTGDKTVNYSYDKENHLLRATIQKGNSVTIESYTYDYEGNRTSKTVNEQDTTYYVNDTSLSLTQVVAETDKDGKEKSYYTRSDELVSMEKGKEVWYYLYDGHGSVRTLTNEAGRVTDRYSYDAYGILLEKEGDTENEFLYTGEQYNANTGLYYLRARYMNPSTGIFISMDSYQGSIYDPVSLHKYLYANANPVMYTDPSGYFSLGECSIATSIQSVLNTTCQLVSLKNVITWAAVGAVIGGIDSYLGGNDFATIIQDAFRGAFFGAIMGCVITTLTFYVAAGSVSVIALQVFRYGFLVAGGVGAYASLEDGHPTQAIFRALLGIFSFFYMGKVIDGIKIGTIGGNQNNSFNRSRFPEDPNDLFPENYPGLEKNPKPDGKIDYIVQSGDKTYKIEFHPQHTGDGHYKGNHYHVLKLGEFPKPGKTKPPYFRLPNLDPDTPAQGGTFAPGDLLPTENN